MVGLTDGSLSTLAPIVAVITVAFELVALAFLRCRFFNTSFGRSFVSVTLGGTIIAAVSAFLGSTA